jgi:hypothetical protein
MTPAQALRDAYKPNGRAHKTPEQMPLRPGESRTFPATINRPLTFRPKKSETFSPVEVEKAWSDEARAAALEARRRGAQETGGQKVYGVGAFGGEYDGDYDHSKKNVDAAVRAVRTGRMDFDQAAEAHNVHLGLLDRHVDRGDYGIDRRRKSEGPRVRE